MARVAHWIQNQSVEYYFSHIDRQNIMNPGAEFLILIPQIIFQSDIFANLIQSISWAYCILLIFMIGSMFHANINQKLFAVVFAASIPMGILQATSTQNDLVASVFCLSIIGNHFLLKKLLERTDFPEHKWILLLSYSISIFSAYLAKPTTIIFAFFFILSSIFHLGKYFLRKEERVNIVENIKLFFISILIGLVILGPDVYRKYKQSGSLTGNRSEIFSSEDDFEIRFANSLKGMFYHSPVSSLCETDVYDYLNLKTGNPYKTKQTDVCTNVYQFNEDYIGNPIQFSIVLFFCFIQLFFRLKKKKKDHSELFIGICLSWFFFHFMVKDQPWISRLQLPFFYSSALLVFALPEINFRKFRFLFYLPILFMIAQSWMTLASNVNRPFVLFGKSFAREWHYFNGKSEIRFLYSSFVDYVKKNKIKDVGLALHGDSWDYPLTWQLTQIGVRVSHVDLLYPIVLRYWMVIVSSCKGRAFLYF
ncbi:hypothetical protein ACKZJ7_18295 [Leptospira sp. 'Mane']